MRGEKKPRDAPKVIKSYEQARIGGSRSIVEAEAGTGNMVVAY